MTLSYCLLTCNLKSLILVKQSSRCAAEILSYGHISAIELLNPSWLWMSAQIMHRIKQIKLLIDSEDSPPPPYSWGGLAVEDCWDTESEFSLGDWPMLGCPCVPANDPTPMCMYAALTVVTRLWDEDMLLGGKCDGGTREGDINMIEMHCVAHVWNFNE